MRLSLVCGSLFLTLAVFAPAALAQKQDAKDKDAEKALKDLQGEWKVTKAVQSGEDAPAKKVADLVLTIKGNEIVANDEPKDAATVTLDPSHTPAWISVSGSRNKKTVIGIYELKGDVLKMCFADPIGDDVQRPKDFTSTKDNKTYLLEMKRVPK